LILFSFFSTLLERISNDDLSLASFETVDGFTLSELVIETIFSDAELPGKDGVTVDDDNTNIGTTTALSILVFISLKLIHVKLRCFLTLMSPGIIVRDVAGIVNINMKTIVIINVNII
jgi:hypothetical protein